MKLAKLERYGIFAIGVVFTALGIALVTQAGMGTTAVASPAYVLSCLFPFSMGFFSILVNLVMMAIQIALMKKSFFPVQLLQLPANFVFGGLIDVFRFLMNGWNPEHGIAWMCLITGCVALGVGVGLQQLGDVLMLPSEGAVRAISCHLGWRFDKVKVGFDILLVAFSAVISAAFLGRIVGVREGTLVVAVFTGLISRFIHNWLTERLNGASS